MAQASGTFEVRLEPQQVSEPEQAAGLGRLSINKQFSGDLEATSTGEMLAAMIEWGIGKMVFQARFFNNVSIMFVGILLIGLSGYLLDRTFLRWLEMVTVERWGMVRRR